MPQSDRVIWQKNVGQNIYDMMDFIITNYDNLPEVTIFCRYCFFAPKDKEKPHGNISEENFLKLSNNKTFTELHDYGKETEYSASKITYENMTNQTGGYLEINNSWYFGPHPGKYYNNLNVFLHDMYKNPVIPDFIRFAPGANYIIPKENILKNSKRFYERIREILSWGVVIGEAHMVERALYTIFTCDWEKNDQYN